MIATTLRRPGTVEETLWLIAETIAATVHDSRVADVAIARRDVTPDEDETECKLAEKAWRDVLPTVDTEWYWVRREYGWTAEEALEVSRLLDAVSLHLRGLAMANTISRETLRRDAAVATALSERWMALTGSRSGGVLVTTNADGSTIARPLRSDP